MCTADAGGMPAPRERGCARNGAALLPFCESTTISTALVPNLESTHFADSLIQATFRTSTTLFDRMTSSEYKA